MVMRDMRDLRARVGTRRMWRYLGEALLVYFFYGFFRLLPVAAASGFAGCLLRWLGPHLRRSRKTILPQLAMALPETTEAERQAIMRDVWENIGCTFAEYAHLHHIHTRVTVAGAEHLAAARDSGRPVIFVGAHLANWEIPAIIVQRAGIPLYGVYRAPNNPWTGRLLHHGRRTGLGDRLIPKGREGARQILSVMREKGALGLLVDQRLSNGVMVDFFGRPAPTAPAVAVFAEKYQAQVHYIWAERLPGARFRVTVSPAVAVPASQDEFLQQINDTIEGWVRAHPGQWLWTHRRWSR